SASADDDAAFAVSDALGGLPVQVDPGVAAGTVRVVLAEDYSGPTGEAAGVESSSPTTTSYEPLPPSIAERPTFDAGGSDVPCVNWSAGAPVDADPIGGIDVTTAADTVLQPLLEADPGAPLVTHYDLAAPSRVELSVTSTANWAAKIAGLLRDEVGVVPGDAV